MIRAGAGLLLLWLVATLVARGAFLDFLAIGPVRPDLLVLLVVYWALAAGTVPGTIGGFLVGLIADVEVGRWLGLHAGMLSLVGFAVGQASRHLIRDNALLHFILIGIATVAVGAVRTVAVHGVGALFGAALMPILGAAVYTAVLGPLVYLITRGIGMPDPLARVPSSE